MQKMGNHRRAQVRWYFAAFFNLFFYFFFTTAGEILGVF